jgi:hypothetical protein
MFRRAAAVDFGHDAAADDTASAQSTWSWSSTQEPNLASRRCESVQPVLVYLTAAEEALMFQPVIV